MNGSYRSLSHAKWYSHYHIVWVPKYRYKILTGKIKEEVEESIRMISKQLKCEVVELNVQKDHVHIIVMIPPNISVSEYVGTVKGKTAIRMFLKYPKLKERPYWGNHFWARGYCVNTIGINLETIRAYVKYQEKNERNII